MKIDLRQAALGDVPHIWEMQKLAFGELFKKYQDFDTTPANEPLEKVINRFSQKGRSYYFIQTDNEIIGVISVAEKDEGRKRLAIMFILPQFQGLGYAQEAIQEIEVIYGKDSWELDTIMQEQKLCYLYEKMGYRRTEKVINVNEKMSLVYYEK